MRFIDDIFSLVWDLSDWFYSAYLEVKGWVWPFKYLAPILLTISDIFWDMVTPIAHLGDWVDDVADAIGDILSWRTIKDLILDWLPKLPATVTWFIDWVKNVLGVIGNWWEGVTPTVKGWIDVAKQALTEIIDAVKKSLAELQAAWDEFWDKLLPVIWDWLNALTTELHNFFTIILPTLITGKIALELIISVLKQWFPFYDDLVQLWENIKQFFADPEDWLYRAFDRIIERFW